MKKSYFASSLLALFASTAAMAVEGPVPTGIPKLDHVFVIMMENHAYKQILGNPNTPFINGLATQANLATNYFAIAHPSLNNYLETVGGSNFGVHADNAPDWHNASCQTNLATGAVSTDNPPTGKICPIAGVGTDAATPAIDYTNEGSANAGDLNIDGVKSIPAATNISGKTIADQLVAAGLTWATYQEALPVNGPDLVNTSDGFFSNLTDFSTITPAQNPPLSQSDVVALYAVKHNPFAYFRNIQENKVGPLSYQRMQPFSGAAGLYATLRAGSVPSFSFIVPSQCDDMHGRGNAGAFCNYDPDDNGSTAGLNPALIIQGDTTLERIVTEIKASSVWQGTRSAIVVMWDENDYSPSPTSNRVVTIVDTNYGSHKKQSAQFYTHFSLLKSIEAAFRLPCLNHACDSNALVMADLFN